MPQLLNRRLKIPLSNKEKTKQNKILIIEDDDFLRPLYKDLFTQEGYVLDICSNGNDGLNRMLHNHYDFIYLDIMLPDMDGLKVMEEFNKSNIEQGKIVFCSNLLSNIAIIEKVFELNADGCECLFNLTPDELILRVKGYIDGDINKERSIREALEFAEKYQQQTVSNDFHNEILKIPQHLHHAIIEQLETHSPNDFFSILRFLSLAPIKYDEFKKRFYIREFFINWYIPDKDILDAYNRVLIEIEKQVKFDDFIIKYSDAVNYYYHNSYYDKKGFYITKNLFQKQYFSLSELDDILEKYNNKRKEKN